MAQSLVADLQKGTETFQFHLYERPLVLGGAGPIRYFWMDSRKFRRRTQGSNFRSCVDSWWADVERFGATHLPECQADLVLAECFPLVSNARSLQDVYLDAHLHSSADREADIGPDGSWLGSSTRTYTLPQEDTDRLRELASKRDMDVIRTELARLFLGSMPAPAEMPAFEKAFHIWVSQGAAALQKAGRAALQHWVQSELSTWLKFLRRQGGQQRVRQFINMFSYECKVSFYRCYANAWLGLISWLVDHQRLDRISERFLRLWHYQNQPVEDPSEPTGGRPDVFYGQVLALHPLSGVILSSADHLQAIGRWIGHPDYEALVQQRRDVSCTEFWEMIVTILIAAHEYYNSRNRWDATRAKGQASYKSVFSKVTHSDTYPSMALVFEDYAAARCIVCGECSSPLDYSHHVPSNAGEPVTVVFHCRGAGHQTVLQIEEEDLHAHLDPDPSSGAC